MFCGYVFTVKTRLYNPDPVLDELASGSLSKRGQVIQAASNETGPALKM
jgi:hypothetical protein